MKESGRERGKQGADTVGPLGSRPRSAILGLLVHPCGSDVIEEGLGCRKVGPQTSGVLGMG